MWVVMHTESIGVTMTVSRNHCSHYTGRVDVLWFWFPISNVSFLYLWIMIVKYLFFSIYYFLNHHSSLWLLMINPRILTNKNGKEPGSYPWMCWTIQANIFFPRCVVKHHSIAETGRTTFIRSRWSRPLQIPVNKFTDDKAFIICRFQ